MPHIAIIVTDGQSNNKALTKTEAAKLKAAGVKVLALGIGSGINDHELKDMASDPDSQYVYKAATFDALASLKGVISSKACEGNRNVGSCVETFETNEKKQAT